MDAGEIVPPRHLHLNLSACPNPVDYCAIPIPTISTAIQEKLDKLDIDQRNRIECNVREILQKHIYDPGTLWQWNYVPDRHPVPRLDCDYEKPRAIDAPKENQPPAPVASGDPTSTHT